VKIVNFSLELMNFSQYPKQNSAEKWIWGKQNFFELHLHLISIFESVY